MEFTSQICTTKEQSERLLALGLKRETADMMFIVLVKDFRGKDVPNAERVYSLCTWYEETSMRVGFEKREYIPAWSLHRLIEILDIWYLDLDFHNFDNAYEQVISYFEERVKGGFINKDYLEERV